MMNSLDAEIGDAVFLDEQEYRLVREEAYRRQDGQESTVLVWTTDCPGCGAAFEVKTARSFSTSPVRRCANCRKPGKPVKGKRGRRVVVSS